MMDFGTGSLTALQRYSGLKSVDAVLLTHMHCDHMLRSEERFSRNAETDL